MAEEGEAREEGEVAASSKVVPEIDFSKKHPLEHTWCVAGATPGGRNARARRVLWTHG